MLYQKANEPKLRLKKPKSTVSKHIFSRKNIFFYLIFTFHNNFLSVLYIRHLLISFLDLLIRAYITEVALTRVFYIDLYF